MRDTKDSQFFSDTSNRESLANHLESEEPGTKEETADKQKGEM